MKTIGLLGGMTAESTIDYYKRINAGINQALGGYRAARMLIYSANLDDVFRWLETEDHDALGEHLSRAAAALEKGGADFMIMACNTAHVVAPRIAARLEIPFVHIADVLGEALASAGIGRVGLLGTRITMDAPFYRDHLGSRFGIDVLLPEETDKDEVDRVIREELCFHRLLDASRQNLVAVSRQLRDRGAGAIVLGCTELGLLLDTDTVAGVPVFDTTALHADRAVALALGQMELPAAVWREKAA